MTELVENQTASLSDAVAQRFALDALLSENAEENAALHAQMLNADLVIETGTASLKTAVESLNALIGQQVNALIVEVNNIVCTEDYETDMKDVVKTMLLSHFTEGILTSEQTARITEVANQCRYSGGYAVLLARGFFEPQESYIQDADCEVGERNNKAEQSIPDGILVFPNPASQSLTLQINQPFERGVARLFNAQGILLSTFNIQSQSAVLPVVDLQNGVYFLDIRLDGQPGMYRAFVKIR